MTGPAPDVRSEFTVDADPALRALRDLGQAFRNVSQRQDELERGGRRTRDTYGGVARVLSDVAAAVGVAKLGDFVKDQISAADAVGKLSQKTGVAVETLSVLGLAGQKAGLQLNDLETDFSRLSKSVEQLQRGAPDTVRAFRTIGLSAQSLAGLSPDQIFLKIADAQARYATNTEKLDAIQRIFGRSASQLLPLLNDLADGGFDHARQRAEELGLVLSGETAKSAAEAVDQLDELKAQASVLALTFANEVLPTLTTVGHTIADTIGSLDPETKRLLINLTALGTVLLGLVAVGRLAYLGLAPLFALLAANPVTGAALIGLALLATAIATLTRNAEDARRTYAGFVKEIGGFSIQQLNTEELALGDRLLEIYDKLDKLRGSQKPEDQTQIDLLNAELRLINAQVAALRRRRTALEGHPQQATPDVPNPELLKAQADAAKQAAADRLKIQAATNKEAQQLADDQFSQGLVGLQQYYDRRRELSRRATANEIADLRAQKAALRASPLADPTDPAQQAKRASDLASLDAQILAKQIEGRAEIAKLDFDERDRAIALATDRLQFEQELQQAKGNTETVALAAIENEAAAFDKLMRQQGVADDERQRKLDDFRRTLQQQAVFQTGNQELDREFQGIARTRQALQDQVTLGVLGERQAEEQLADFEKSRLPTLRALAAQALALAQNLGPEAIAQAQQLAQQVDDIAAAADLASQRTAALLQSLQQGFASDISDFLTKIGTDISQLGTAVLDLVRSVAETIVQTFAQRIGDVLSESLVDGLRRGISQAADSGSTVKLATGAIAVEQAGSALNGAGDKVIAAGGTILIAAQRLDAAATRLLTAAIAAKAAAGGSSGDGGVNVSDLAAIGLQIALGFNSGGVVPGAGAGDTVPAMLTPGEGVLTLSEMRELGGPSGFLALRQFLTGHSALVPPIRRSGVDHYGTGGVVRQAAPAAAASSAGSHVVIELADGLIARVLQSDDGSEAMVRVMERRRSDVLSALEVPA